MKIHPRNIHLLRFVTVYFWVRYWTELPVGTQQYGTVRFSTERSTYRTVRVGFEYIACLSIDVPALRSSRVLSKANQVD